jgi:hypothetical protein
MRRRILFPILVLVIFISSAQAQIGGWQNVENLTAGTVIAVQTEYRPTARCTFEHATERTLFCALVHRARFLGPQEVILDRSEIRQIMLEVTNQRNMAKGILIGAGIGATIGAIPDPDHSGYTRLGGALLLGAIGAAIGGVVGKNHSSNHYRVIYRQ